MAAMRWCILLLAVILPAPASDKATAEDKPGPNNVHLNANEFEVKQLDTGTHVRRGGEGATQWFEFELPQVGRILAAKTISINASPGDEFRFSTRVSLHDVVDAQGSRIAPRQVVNFDQTRVCLTILQLDAQGRRVAEVSCRPLLGDGDAMPLHVDTLIQPGVSALKVQCRALNVSGTVRFGDLMLEKLALNTEQPVAESKLVSNSQGGRYWSINGEHVPWAFYFGNNQFSKDEAILNEIDKVKAAGVRVISFNLGLPSNTSLDTIDDVLERFMARRPELFFMPRIWLATPAHWEETYGNELMRYDDGTTGPLASPASPAWSASTTFNIEQLVRHIRRGPYARRFCGMIPIYYQTGEWILAQPTKAAGFEEPVRRGFSAWALARYGGLNALNDAWRAQYQSSTAINVPSKEERYSSQIGLFHDPAKECRAIDFSEFYNGLIPKQLTMLATAAKRATQRSSLVGYFYGYTFEMAWNDTWPQQTGHLGLGQMFAAPEIDFYGCSYSYNFDNRYFGMPIDLNSPFDSAPLHGKAAFLEEDTYTHVAEAPPAGALAPGYQHAPKNLSESLAVVKRNIGVATAHGLMMHWQNLLSDGRFNLTEIWDFYRNFYKWAAPKELTRKAYRPQVAVVVDEAAYHYERVPARAIYGRWVYEQRMALDRVDATIGYYLQSDLDRIPDSVRCLILLTPYALTPAQEVSLRQRWMQGGRTIVFCYMPQAMTPAGWREHVGEITGMKLQLHREELDPAVVVAPAGIFRPFAGKVIGTGRDRVYEETVMWDKPVAPYLTVEPGSADVWAYYRANGGGACAVKQMTGWRSYFLGAPIMEPAMWRAIMREAGCHLFLESLSDDWRWPDVIAANEYFLMVQSGRDGERQVKLPRRYAVVRQLGEVERPVVARDAEQFEIRAQRGVPQLFALEE
jgi:hypothetical protein